MKIFLISPVRGITADEHNRIAAYIGKLEAAGNQVYWPERDTLQDDPCGLWICSANRDGIKDADAVHVWWNKASEGSRFDLGMAFALGKRIVLANRIASTPHKSFENVLLELTGGKH